VKQKFVTSIFAILQFSDRNTVMESRDLCLVLTWLETHISWHYLVSVSTRVRMILVLGYWYWAIFIGIGWYCYLGIFLVVLTPNTIPIRQQSAPSACQWTII